MFGSTGSGSVPSSGYLAAHFGRLDAELILIAPSEAPTCSVVIACSGPHDLTQEFFPIDHLARLNDNFDIASVFDVFERIALND